MQTAEINSTKIVFDKNKTEKYRTNFNNTCDCQNCRNYYKNVENNRALLDFLKEFGIDFKHAEEVFSWSLSEDKNSLIHHEGCYGVFGNIEGEDFEFDKFGVRISFSEDAHVPCDREGEFFWICINGDFPYVLEEERELCENDDNFSEIFPREKEKQAFLKKLKSYFTKK